MNLALREQALEMTNNAASFSCPKCEVAMQTTFFTGIEVERCPRCHGLFFDQGEVEKAWRRWTRFKRFLERKHLGWFRSLIRFQ